MAIELVRDANEKKPKLICPQCRQIMVVTLAHYEIDATKPILSNCPYCGAEIYSCVLLMASRSLKHLQNMINQAMSSVSADVARDNVIIDGKPLRKPS